MSMMRRGLLLGLMLVLPAEAVLASREIHCASTRNGYQHCPAETRGRVELLRQTSRAPCIEGQTWGYDRRGVWVDRGCAAHFKVGRPDRSREAVAAVAAIAVVGAIIASNQNDHGASGPRVGSRPPDWAVGDFYGYDPRHRLELWIRVEGDGYIRGQRGRERVDGQFTRDHVWFDGQAWNITRLRDGFRLDAQGGRSSIDFRRDR